MQTQLAAAAWRSRVKGLIMQVKLKTLENGDVRVDRTYFDGAEDVTDSTTLRDQGAYVYRVNPNGTTTQVCEGLRPTGPTLMAGADLAQTVSRTLGFERWLAWADGRQDDAVEFLVPIGGTFDVAEAGANALGIDVSDVLNVKKI